MITFADSYYSYVYSLFFFFLETSHRVLPLGRYSTVRSRMLKRTGDIKLVVGGALTESAQEEGQYIQAKA